MITIFSRSHKTTDWQDLGNSRLPEWEEQCRRIASKRQHLTVFWKIGRTGRWCKAFGIWSGLSESNRHLNLGKVPYYHYTKAAQPLSFYSTPARQRQALPAIGIESQTRLRSDQETCVIRADFTTGERRCRSAKRVALILSV